MRTAEGASRAAGALWDAVPDRTKWILLSEPRHLMYFANFCAAFAIVALTLALPAEAPTAVTTAAHPQDQQQRLASMAALDA